MRYAVLRHDTPDGGFHFDLLFERGDTLKSWRYFGPAWPPERSPVDIEAHTDHRKLYLDYEGPVSGDRGTVTRAEGGPYEISLWTDDHLELRLAGRTAILDRTGRRERNAELWTLTIRPG